jgi:hypothetical protein
MTRKGYINAAREWLGENDMVVGSVELRIHYIFYPGCAQTYWQPREEDTAELDFVQIKRHRDGKPVWARLERNQPATEPGGVDGEDWYCWAEDYLDLNMSEVLEDQSADDADAAEYRAECRRDDRGLA